MAGEASFYLPFTTVPVSALSSGWPVDAGLFTGLLALAGLESCYISATARAVLPRSPACRVGNRYQTLQRQATAAETDTDGYAYE